MMTTSTIAPILVVPNALQSAQLYCAAFGFERMRYFDGNDEYIVLERDGAQLHLMQGRWTNPNHEQSGHVADVFCWVDDLQPLVAAAHEYSLTITRGPEHYDSTPVATTEVVISDRDGYWLCFGVAD